MDYYIDAYLDRILDEIEEDMKSVWSTNRSEQESQQESAQLSADRKAAGIASDIPSPDSTASLSMTTGGGMSSDSEPNSTVSVDHSHDEFFKGNNNQSESRFSGTNSENLRAYTQGSISQGTSNDSDSASTVSTVSIELQAFAEFFSDHEGNSFSFLENSGRPLTKNKVGRNGGYDWSGDGDAELLFGTMWLDQLYGGAGNDLIYGFEGDDTITGGYGEDRLFGGAGDDLIILSGTPTTIGPGDPNSNMGSTPSLGTFVGFASGGSGNDHIIGGNGDETVFGGTGHDYI